MFSAAHIMSMNNSVFFFNVKCTISMKEGASYECFKKY